MENYLCVMTHGIPNKTVFFLLKINTNKFMKIVSDSTRLRNRIFGGQRITWNIVENNTRNWESNNNFDLSGISARLNCSNLEQKFLGRNSKSFRMWLVGSFRGRRFRLLHVASSKVPNTQRLRSKLVNSWVIFFTQGRQHERRACFTM